MISDDVTFWNGIKLEDHLYLIKREDGHYILAKPVYDLNKKLTAWLDQWNMSYPVYDDDDVISSVERIEERRHQRAEQGIKTVKGLHIKRTQVGVRLPDHELCECGNPECDGTGTYRSGYFVPGHHLRKTLLRGEK